MSNMAVLAFPCITPKGANNRLVNVYFITCKYSTIFIFSSSFLRTCLLQRRCMLLNLGKLPRKVDDIQVRTQVVAVIIWVLHQHIH